MRREHHHEPVAPAASPAQCEFTLLGPFAVQRDGMALTGQQVGSRKARTLLKRLLVEPDRVVGTEALIEVLWPERPPDHPQRHLATMVSRLRAALGAAVAIREGHGYRIGGLPVYRIDLVEAEGLADEAEARLSTGEPGLAYAAASRSLALLGRGELLADDPYADWAAPARAQARSLLRRVRRCAWAAGLAVGDLDRVIREAEATLAEEPFQEEACRALMRAYWDGGSPGLALAAYERLKAALASELGTDPSEETRSVHLAILRAEPEGRRVPAAANRLPASDVGLVGRGAELAWLRDAWSRACTGDSGLLLLVGEAGIGKTRLATEVVGLAESTGAIVARARCYEAERSLFLQPVVDALRPVVTSARPELVREAAGDTAGSLAYLVPEVGAVVPVGEQPRASPEVERRRLFDAVVGFFRSLAERQPVLLFLDDLHQAGSATVELLHLLLRRVGGHRLLGLATVRVEEASDVVAVLADIAQRWDVGPLPPAAVGELARRSGLAAMADEIMSHTRGHTLSVVETLRAMRDQPAALSGLSVPDSLRTAVLARLRRAGPAVAELLQAAATLGSNFDPATLAALEAVPLADVVRRCETASQARLLVEAGTGYEFANDLIREIAYQATPLPLRVARHRRAAELLPGSPELVALHASRAGEWAAAAAAYRQAAAGAARRYAHHDAARLVERAVDAAVRADDQAGVAHARLLRGQVREVLADFPGAYEDHTAVVEFARVRDDPYLEIAALRQLGGDVTIGMGRPVRECIPYLEAALERAGSVGDVPTQIDVLGRLAVLWTNRLRFDRAQRLVDRALALAQAPPGAAVRVLALDAGKSVLAYQGRVPELAAMLPRLTAHLHDEKLWSMEAREAFEAGGRRGGRYPAYRIWAILESSFPALARADWPAASDRLGEAMAVIEESGYPAYRAPVLAHLQWVERARGRYGEAVQLGRQAVQIAETTGHPWWIALSAGMLGWTLTEIGALDEAVDSLERGLRAAERDATEGFLVRCLGHLAWAYSLHGEPARAAALADRAEALLAGVTGGVFLHGAHATLATAAARLALGQPALAERLIEPLRPAAEAAGWVEIATWADLLLARCRWAVADQPRAVALAEAGLQRGKDGRLPGLVWQARALLAEASPHGGDQHRVTASEQVEQLAGAIVDDQLRTGYRRHASALLRGSAPTATTCE